MTIIKQSINIQSRKIYDLQDITPQIEQFIHDSEAKTGLINIFIKHTSAAIFINEYEPGLLQDFQNKLEEFNPVKKYYEHNQSHICKNEMCFNGHSHCNALFLPAQLTLQIIDGKLNIGEWQKIIFVELDRDRNRKIDLMIIS